MNRSIPLSYLLLGLFLFIWTNLPHNASNQIRSFTVMAASPTWRVAGGLKNYLSDRPIPGNKKGSPLELSELRLENQILKSELETAKAWNFYEKSIERERSVLPQRRAYLADLLERQASALPGRVIYRVPSSWSNSLWIDVGEEDNRVYGRPIISRNSPVIDGHALIGVVDYVGSRQSRVRLITDSGVTPAVRVARGTSQQREILSLVGALAERLEGEKESLETLNRLKQMVGEASIDLYLAKGELRGNGAPFWRSRPILKGIGFNCDYPDAEGPARDLRTGRPLIGSHPPVPLIQKGDHLITSGLDGVFPPGLSVAIVRSVFPLKEGSFSYEIEAIPTAHALNDLQILFVLPTLSGEE